MPPPVIASARGALLVDTEGREHIDFSMGYGSVWLGHGHPAVTRALQEQLGRYASPGYFASGAYEAAEAAFARLLPSTHVLGGIYSTGMEAVEAALRAAWAHTGRCALAGFRGSEHGRSFLSAALGGWSGRPAPEFVHLLPAFAQADEIPGEAAALARRVELAAMVVEPVQMTGGGRALDAQTAKALFALAREHGFAVIFDEALTAPYRCGAPFYFDRLGVAPDILVLGKGLGNGFPCAAVALRRGVAWDRARVRPGSTFWNHPLACAAVGATLGELEALKPSLKVKEIESVVKEQLGDLRLRGQGALWTLELPDPARQAQFVERLLAARVVTSYYPGYVRLLPPITIEPESLRRGCKAIRSAYADTFG
jgi:acetylornithine/succinyldiaminopimelate/putrescine aminotransferase